MTALGKLEAVYWVALELHGLMAIFWVLWIGEGCVSHIVECSGGSMIDELGKFWLFFGAFLRYVVATLSGKQWKIVPRTSYCHLPVRLHTLFYFTLFWLKKGMFRNYSISPLFWPLSLFLQIIIIIIFLLLQMRGHHKCYPSQQRAGCMLSLCTCLWLDVCSALRWALRDKGLLGKIGSVTSPLFHVYTGKLSWGTCQAQSCAPCQLICPKRFIFALW